MTDPEQDIQQLGRRWLAWLEGRLPEARKLELEELVRPSSSGFSNDTLVARVRYWEEGRERRRQMVIRANPKGYPVFPFYDIGRQFDIMTALRLNSQVPVPHCLWKESEELELLGGTFYVMDYVEGEVPSDNPPYPVAGFVKEASPAQRARLWWNGLEQLAAIHGLDWEQAGMGFLDWPDPQSSPIQQHLDYYQAYLEWAAAGREQPVASTALDWLRSNMPESEPKGIIWGDARVGNQMFRDFEVVAVLDWEMAALGNPEADLGWWLFVDEVTMAGNGQPDLARPRLEGLPSEEETVARYQELTGRPVRWLHYYKVFAGLRFACVMIRLMQRMSFSGQLPEEFVPPLERNNIVTQLLARLLDLPPPE